MGTVAQNQHWWWSVSRGHSLCRAIGSYSSFEPVSVTRLLPSLKWQFPWGAISPVWRPESPLIAVGMLVSHRFDAPSFPPGVMGSILLNCFWWIVVKPLFFWTLAGRGKWNLESLQAELQRKGWNATSITLFCVVWQALSGRRTQTYTLESSLFLQGCLMKAIVVRQETRKPPWESGLRQSNVVSLSLFPFQKETLQTWLNQQI